MLNSSGLVSRLRNNMHKYSRYKGGWGYRKSLTAATFACTHTTFASYVFQRVVKQMHGWPNPPPNDRMRKAMKISSSVLDEETFSIYF